MFFKKVCKAFSFSVMCGVLEGGLGLEHNCHPTTKAMKKMDVRTDCAPFFKRLFSWVHIECDPLFLYSVSKARGK